MDYELSQRQVHDGVSLYVPDGHFTLDESMTKFKGRLQFRQYMPVKPIKWGVKVWTLAESTTGYMSWFQVYTGREYHWLHVTVPSVHRQRVPLATCHGSKCTPAESTTGYMSRFQVYTGREHYWLHVTVPSVHRQEMATLDGNDQEIAMNAQHPANVPMNTAAKFATKQPK